MSPLVLFDDSLGRFGPMTDLRAVFEIRTGALTTVARIAGAVGAAGGALAALWVPQRLRTIVAERSAFAVNEIPASSATGAITLLNGRWSDAALPELPGIGEALVEAETGHVIAATLPADTARRWLDAGEWTVDSLGATRSGHPIPARPAPAGATLLRRAWDVLRCLDRTLGADAIAVELDAAQDVGVRAITMGAHPVRVHASAVISPGVVFDASAGPILIERGAVVRPGAILCGPCAVGAGSTVLERALIKARTVIGPHCKIGGEVGGTIFQGWANKSHDGHLGDSWVGEWANLGAGTTNSNLLNTYGEVSMRLDPAGPRERTGMTFLGSIIGDHTKLAICTRLMTGTVIGTGAMIASTAPAPATVARYAWITDDGERTYGIEKFLGVMNTVMARRSMTPSDAYVAAVRALAPSS